MAISRRIDRGSAGVSVVRIVHEHSNHAEPEDRAVHFPFWTANLKFLAALYFSCTVPNLRGPVVKIFLDTTLDGQTVARSLHLRVLSLLDVILLSEVTGRLCSYPLKPKFWPTSPMSCEMELFHVLIASLYSGLRVEMMEFRRRTACWALHTQPSPISSMQGASSPHTTQVDASECFASAFI
jgi:hypothetical protein